MKKFTFWVMAFALLPLVSLWVSVSADSILDFLNYAESGIWSFGYNSSDRLSILSVSNSFVDVESPLIKDGSKNITSYIFSASTERWYGNPVAYWCFDDVSINWNKFSVELDVRSLDQSQVYYLYSIPLDLGVAWVYSWECTVNDVTTFLNLWVAWKESAVNWEDPCFRINDRVYGEGTYCAWHNTASNNQTSVYSINWVSHVFNWSEIKLTWNSFADVNIEVFLWNDDRNTFEKLGDVDSDRKSYTFTARYNGDHIVVPKEVKPVVVWPKENIMLILFGTLILYIVYRLARRKA